MSKVKMYKSYSHRHPPTHPPPPHTHTHTHTTQHNTTQHNTHTNKFNKKCFHFFRTSLSVVSHLLHSEHFKTDFWERETKSQF